MPDWYGHILPSEVDLVLDAPAFTQLVSDTLGNAGGPDDGMDEQLLQIMSDTAGLATLLDLIDGPLGFLLGPSPGIDDNALARSSDLLNLNIATVAADRDAFAQLVEPDQAPPPDDGGTLTNTSGGGGASPTPAAEAACQQGQFYTVRSTAFAGQMWFGGISIQGSPFDAACVTTGAEIVPSSDTQYFNLTALLNVPVGFNGPYNVANLSGTFPVAGTYTCQVEIDFNVLPNFGPGSLTVCVVVTVS